MKWKANTLVYTKLFQHLFYSFIPRAKQNKIEKRKKKRKTKKGGKALAILFSMIFYFNSEDVGKMSQKHIIRKAGCASHIEKAPN